MKCLYTVFKLETGFFSNSISENRGASGWADWCPDGVLSFEDKAAICSVHKETVHPNGTNDFTITADEKANEDRKNKMYEKYAGEPYSPPVQPSLSNLPWVEVSDKLVRLDFEISRMSGQNEVKMTDSAGASGRVQERSGGSGMECVKISE